jgi:hypothetical protein
VEIVKVSMLFICLTDKVPLVVVGVVIAVDLLKNSVFIYITIIVFAALKHV